MTAAELSNVEQKVLAIVDRLTKKNQLIRIKELFALAKKELKFQETEIEQAIWKLISKKYIVDGTRLTKETVLENDRRQKMLKLIFDSPGVHIRDVRSELNTGSYLTSWHLRVLEKFGFIRKKRHKNMVLLFPYLLQEEKEDAFLILKDDISSQINEFILEKGMVSRQDVMDQFKLDQETAQTHIDLLLSADLLDFKEEDGVETYWVNADQLKPILDYWKQKDGELAAITPEKPPELPPPAEDVPVEAKEKAPELVEAKREYDYLGGNIRFKIAVRNITPTMVSKVRVMLTPTDQFKYEADVKAIETLSPGESRGVDFLLTPMTCGKSQVFATVSYVDAYGKPNSLTVAPKEIWVKCPLVTSVKAEMKDLLDWQAGLQSGMSSLSFEGLSKENAFGIVSDQISALDLSLVQVDDAQLKAIYSGEAKVTNTKIIVEVETYEDAVKLVVWASDLKQVTGFMAYIKNLVNIALGMSKTLRMKEEKVGEKLLNAFEFVERLIQLFEYAEQNWALSEVLILLKEISRRIQRDLPSLPMDIQHWVTNFDDKITAEATLTDQEATQLEYDTFIYLEKVADLIQSNLEMYKSAFQEDTKIIPMIEEKYKDLMTILADLEKRYSKRTMKFLLVIDNTSGLTMFQQSFSEAMMDSDLVSGFLTAIQSFGTEFSADGSTEMKKLAYKDFEIEINIGDHIRAALFLSGPTSKYLVGALVKFITRFEKTYGENLKAWSGDVTLFEDAGELVAQIFGWKSN
jgi:predicted transcriptional regulator